MIDAVTAIFHADIGPRYWEDCSVNGRPNYGDDERDVPLASDGRWKLSINVETGQVAGWPVGTSISTWFKVCDDGTYSLEKCGKIVASQEGYVPRCLQINKNGYGDYVYITIGPDGFIREWDGQSALSFFAETNNGD